MYKFKSLEWYKLEQQDGICAEPIGLEWKYSIVTLENGQIEFAVLDAGYEYTQGFPAFCNSVAQAKEHAAKHYLSFVAQFVEW
jgi:hypothetical protein